ncbi:MAG: phosphoheptose isomerase [Flavobacteriaceae bacterium]|nr:phosphoheptose isomerase [Flavobacteriaceae bacterium]|tara:strand:- start:2797 stop:3369 length:573 start_codon:yes stop_codon:yes gene_type:complete
MNIKEEIKESIFVKENLLNDKKLINQIEELANLCLESIKNGGKIIFAGNGGSFADSQHLTAEFVSRLRFDRSPLASVALGTNSSTMSAIGNDYGYDNVFKRELIALGSERDIFIPITTSGNSLNIILAIEEAKKIGIKTIVLTGNEGGKAKSISECIIVPSLRTERVQECHILIGHIVCGLVEEKIFKNS